MGGTVRVSKGILKYVTRLRIDPVGTLHPSDDSLEFESKDAWF